jgi:hypothetical protein
MLKKPMLLVAALASFLLTGCATNFAGTADSSCKAFQTIAMSKRDTDETKRQIIGHNRAYEAICPARERGNG